MHCMAIEGAMYAFPMMELPPAFVAQCKAERTAPDAAYCKRLLQRHGYVTVPGSGFAQREGTFHFRVTILASEGELERFLVNLKQFHEEEVWGLKATRSNVELFQQQLQRRDEQKVGSAEDTSRESHTQGAGAGALRRHRTASA